ncbi:uncharacterized protein [Rutidosis leptorrhynchoides]|uniref:uncharacterized protein n=1 Tax=Rutidosis leptorrhynchoides TaxID=125765 RepID=UPI003A9A53CB
MVWWNALTSSIRKENVKQITWEQFQWKVGEQYCSSFDLNRLKTEFLEMRIMPRMLINEVIGQFMDKLRFVSQWVPDEASRIQHFINVILLEYRMSVRIAKSLSHAFVIARMVESDLKAVRGMMTGSVMTPSGQMGGQSSEKSKKSSGYRQKGKSKHGSSGTASGRGHRAVSFPSKSVSSGAGLGARSASVGGSTTSSGQKRKNPPTAEAGAFWMSVEKATETDEVITVRVEVGNGKITPITTFVTGVSIDIEGKSFPMTCLVLPIPSFDVMLEMDLLIPLRASIKCDRKMISFHLADGTRVIARAERGGYSFPLISMMKAKKSLSKGCESFLAYVVDCKKEKKAIADIPVVSEFTEVFPDELPGLPPVREVEYNIELVPGATPVAKSSYRLAPSEICEMMSKIHDLLDRGFIRPSSSPWGAPPTEARQSWQLTEARQGQVHIRSTEARIG